MELKYLPTLKAILQTGSFYGAARKLNYAQSTITFQVQQLEHEMGIKLFEKIGRRMVLTQAGEEIMPYVDAILENMERLESYGQTVTEMKGSLRVLLAETLLTYQMQPVLAEFHRQAPQVQLSLQAMNCYRITDEIVNGNADIGIHYNVGGYGNASVIAERLQEYRTVLVGHPSLPAEERDFITRGQRKELCLLVSDTDGVYQRRIDHYLTERDIRLGGVMEVGATEAIKSCLLSNLGVAYLPQHVLASELADGRLIELPTEVEKQTVTALCVYHKNKWITPAMELFIRILKEQTAKGVFR